MVNEILAKMKMEGICYITSNITDVANYSINVSQVNITSVENVFKEEEESTERAANVLNGKNDMAEHTSLVIDVNDTDNILQSNVSSGEINLDDFEELVGYNNNNTTQIDNTHNIAEKLGDEKSNNTQPMMMMQVVFTLAKFLPFCLIICFVL